MSEIHSIASEKRVPGHPIHLDMTPMVDLAFLLLTFFILATTMAKPKTMELVYPDESGPRLPVEDENTYTLLLGQTQGDVRYYKGMLEINGHNVKMTTLGTDGFRSVLLKNMAAYRNKPKAPIASEGPITSGQEASGNSRNQLFDTIAAIVIVKTLDQTPYESVVNALDELTIAGIKKYSVQDMDQNEQLILGQE